MLVGLVTQEQIEALGAVAARLDAKGLADESRMVREVLAQLEHAPRELGAAAAAEILAVTPQTVRNWVRGGVLPGRRDRTGRFLVAAKLRPPITAPVRDARNRLPRFASRQRPGTVIYLRPACSSASSAAAVG